MNTYKTSPDQPILSVGKPGRKKSVKADYAFPMERTEASVTQVLKDATEGIIPLRQASQVQEWLGATFQGLSNTEEQKLSSNELFRRLALPEEN